MGTLPGSIHRELAREWCAAFYPRKSEIPRTLLIVSLFLLSTLNSTVNGQTPAGFDYPGVRILGTSVARK